MAILPGRRIRDNGIFGTITDNPLTIGATTFNSANLADLVAVSGNHAIVTLDPLAQHGDPEIVMITAHTAASTTATITRAMYGTVARAHPQGTLWVHAATQDDYKEVVTSSTRPGDQYEGQFIYETDTDYTMIHDGSTWEYGSKVGAALAWTPSITQGATPAQSVARARYSRNGRWISAVGGVSFTGAGTAGQTIRMTGLPFACAAANNSLFGSFKYFDAGNTVFVGACWNNTTTEILFNVSDEGNNFGVTFPTIANGDFIQFGFQYEAAS